MRVGNIRIGNDKEHDWGIGVGTGYSVGGGTQAVPLFLSLRNRISNIFELGGELNYLAGKYEGGENWSTGLFSLIGKAHLWIFYLGTGSSYRIFFNKEGSPTGKIIFDDTQSYFNYLTGFEIRVANNWDVFLEWRNISSFSKNSGLFLAGFHYNF